VNASLQCSPPHSTSDTHNVVSLYSTAESALKSFLSGGVGGLCCVLVGHPFDLIKVRMQTGTGKETIAGLFSQMIRTSGPWGLYKGVSAPLIAVTPMFAVSFWSYDMGQRIVRYVKGTHDLNLTDKCIAGGLSAIPTTAIMAPSERIKVLLQTAAPGQYRGMSDCLMQVYRTGGIPSVFRGTGLTLMRDIPGSVAWFGMYEAAKVSLMRAQGLTDTSQLSPLAVLTAGGLAGMACWTVSIPFDVLKSRFQSAPDGTYPGGARDVLKRLLREEGPGALVTGIKPALLRAFPANAACFLGMEVSRKFLAFMD
jgi:solute carrier family 25 (mitochondrial carnitine/acylcarnitine transporter), member 20/29